MGVKGDARRAVIIESALELFSERGFEGVTTKAIAEKAGITESALFRYFRTKRILYDSVLQEQAPTDIFPTASPDERTRCDGFELVFRNRVSEFLDGIWQRRASVRVEVIGMLCSQEEARRADAPGEDVRSQVQIAIVRGAECGETRSECAEAAGLLVASAVVGFLLRVFVKPPADWLEDRNQFVNSLCSIVLPMVVVSKSNTANT